MLKCSQGFVVITVCCKCWISITYAYRYLVSPGSLIDLLSSYIWWCSYVYPLPNCVVPITIRATNYDMSKLRNSTNIETCLHQNSCTFLLVCDNSFVVCVLLSQIGTGIVSIDYFRNVLSSEICCSCLWDELRTRCIGLFSLLWSLLVLFPFTKISKENRSYIHNTIKRINYLILNC